MQLCAVVGPLRPPLPGRPCPLVHLLVPPVACPVALFAAGAGPACAPRSSLHSPCLAALSPLPLPRHLPSTLRLNASLPAVSQRGVACLLLSVHYCPLSSPLLFIHPCFPVVGFTFAPLRCPYSFSWSQTPVCTGIRSLPSGARGKRPWRGFSGSLLTEAAWGPVTPSGPRPASSFPRKAAGEWRLVVNYRGLNAQTQHDSYTLPLIEDMLQKEFRRRIFMVIGLKDGYHKMPPAEESRACTAMSTLLGPLQWKVMPIGVTNGNSAFQRIVENLLETVRDCADPFVDDVIIASGDPSMSYDELLEAHERDVTRVLDLRVRHKLTGSSDKATIAVSEAVFAGQVVGNGQQEPIPGKIAAIEHCEKPKTVSKLRAYLVFCNYYSGYIKMHATYAAPMTAMLKDNLVETKKALVCNEESDCDFEGMKQALLSAVGLHVVDPYRAIVLRRDASDYVIGAVLEQVLDDGRHVLVAFWSRVLAEGKRRTWTPCEREAYVIDRALRKSKKTSLPCRSWGT